jgi:subtilisin-like proprotein convertase family protein
MSAKFFRNCNVVGIWLVVAMLCAAPIWAATIATDLTVVPTEEGTVILTMRATPNAGGTDVVYDVYRVTSLSSSPPVFSSADIINTEVIAQNSDPNDKVLLNTSSQVTNGPFDGVAANNTQDGQPYWYQVVAIEVNGVGTRLTGISEATFTARRCVADILKPTPLNGPVGNPDLKLISTDFIPGITITVLTPNDTVLNNDSVIASGNIAQTAEPTPEYRFRLAWFRQAQSVHLGPLETSLPVETGSAEITVGFNLTYEVGAIASIGDSTGLTSGTEYSYFVQVIDTVGNRNGVSTGLLIEDHLSQAITAINPVTLTPAMEIVLGENCSSTVIEWEAYPDSMTTDPLNFTPVTFGVYAASRTTPISSLLDLQAATLIEEITATGGAGTVLSVTHSGAHPTFPRLAQRTYAYVVVCTDEKGLTGPLSEPAVLYAADAVDPATCVITMPATGEVVSGTVTITALCQDNPCGGSGIDRTDFSVVDATGDVVFAASDDTDYPSGATMAITHVVQWDTLSPVVPDGPGYVVSATTFDFAGNDLQSINQPEVYVDNTVPSVAGLIPVGAGPGSPYVGPGSYVNNVVIFSGTSSDPSGIARVIVGAQTSIGQITAEAAGTAIWLATLDFSPLPSEEVITWNVTAEDNIGNLGQAFTPDATMAIDTTAPITELNCPVWIGAASITFGSVVTATGTDVGTIQAGINNATITAVSADAPTILSGSSPLIGAFTFATVTPVHLDTLTVSAESDDLVTDQRSIAAGVTTNPCRPNLSAATTSLITFDLVPPECMITAPPNNTVSTATTPFTIIGEATDVDSGLYILEAVIVEESNPGTILDATTSAFAGAPNVSGFTFDIDPGQDGIFIVTVTVYDMANNSATCEVRLIRDTLPPIAEVLAVYDNLDVATSVTICGTASDVFGEIDGVTLTIIEWVGGAIAGTVNVTVTDVTGATNSVTWCVPDFDISDATLVEGSTIEAVAFASTNNPTETGPTGATRTMTVDLTVPDALITSAIINDGSMTGNGIDPGATYFCSSEWTVSGTAEDFGGVILLATGVDSVDLLVTLNGVFAATTGTNFVTGIDTWSATMGTALSGAVSSDYIGFGNVVVDNATAGMNATAVIDAATYILDCSAPTGTLLTPLAGLYLAANDLPYTYIVGASEEPYASAHVGLSSAEFFIDGFIEDTDLSIQGTTEANASGIIPATLADGTHTIEVWVWDMLGNLTITASEEFIIDSVSPTVTITRPLAVAPTITVNIQLLTQGNVIDNVGGSGIAYATLTYGNSAIVESVSNLVPLLDATGDWSIDVEVDASFVDGDIWEVTVEAEDLAGNIADVSVESFFVDTVEPQIVNTSAPANAGTYVNGNLQYFWTVDDNVLGTNDSGVRYATAVIRINGVVYPATITLPTAMGLQIPINYGTLYPNFIVLLDDTMNGLGMASGTDFAVGLMAEDAPFDIPNVTTVFSVTLTWDIEPPAIQITNLRWPNGDSIEVATGDDVGGGRGGCYIISCASFPVDIIGSVTDDSGLINQVEIFYATETGAGALEHSITYATINAATSTFEALDVPASSLNPGKIYLYAVAIDGVTTSTPNASVPADVRSASSVGAFIDNSPPTVTWQNADPVAATYASLRTSNITIVVEDSGTGINADGAMALTATPQTFDSINVPIFVPDLGVGRSLLCVPDVGVITGITITVEMDHTFIGDLDMFLTSPTGTVEQFKIGGFGQPYPMPLVYVLDATFAGEQGHGTWVLDLDDILGLDDGSLTAWSLEITGVVTQTVTYDMLQELVHAANPDMTPAAMTLASASGNSATYTASYTMPVLQDREGHMPVEVVVTDLGGCVLDTTLSMAQNFLFLVDNTPPSPNRPDLDPLIANPTDFNYPSDDTIAIIGGATGVFDWDYQVPGTWTDNELRNPWQWDQYASLNPAPVRQFASPTLTLAGQLIIEGQAYDNFSRDFVNESLSGIETLEIYWAYGDPNTPPDPSDFTDPPVATVTEITPPQNVAGATFMAAFDASQIVGTFYIKTLTRDRAGNELDPIYGPFIGVDVIAPAAITWLRATSMNGSSDVLLDWHMGGPAPDNVVTTTYELYRTKTQITVLSGLDPVADFDLLDTFSAVQEDNGIQDVLTYLDQIPGTGTWGYYIVGVDAAGNGAQGAFIAGNRSNMVAAAKNDVEAPLPVTDLRVVSVQPDTAITLRWSIPDDVTTLLPFDGDNVGITEFNIFRVQQTDALADTDPDDEEEDLITRNLLTVQINNFVPNELVEEKASIVGSATNLIQILSPPIDATAVTRVFNQSLGVSYDVLSVTERTIVIEGAVDVPLPGATDVILVDYETYDRILVDEGVIPGLDYAYAIVARDAASNNSPISQTVESSTATTFDTTAPDAITELWVTTFPTNTTMTLEWPSTPYDNVGVMAYNVLCSTAGIFDVENIGKDVRVLQQAGFPQISYAPSATDSIMIELATGIVDLTGTLSVIDRTTGKVIPSLADAMTDPGFAIATDPYWEANVGGVINSITVTNSYARDFSDPVSDSVIKYPCNLVVAYFQDGTVLLDGASLKEQLTFTFDPVIAYGTDIVIENEILYFAVMAVDPSGNQAMISNIASAQVTPIAPQIPAGYVFEVSPQKTLLPGMVIGGEDIVYAMITDVTLDWDVARVEVWFQDNGTLSFVNSADAPLITGGVAGDATGYYEITVGDNMHDDLFVVVVDLAGNRSEALVLWNDIVAPPMPVVDVDRNKFNMTPVNDEIYGWVDVLTEGTVQVHLYNDAGLSDLIAAVLPSPTGEWHFSIADITPEFVYVTALDMASNESDSQHIDVIPDAPVITTDPTVLLVEPLRTRYHVMEGIWVTTGGEDRIIGSAVDPDLAAIRIYSDDELDTLEFSDVPSATGYFDTAVGDNYLPWFYVVSEDTVGHQSAFVRLFNDIVPPATPAIDQIFFNPAPVNDVIHGWTSYDAVAINVYNDKNLVELLGSFPIAGGEFMFNISDITPEFVYITALDAASNETGPAIVDVIPDPPTVDITMNPPIRVRANVTVGEVDYVIGSTNDPEVVRVEIYNNSNLEYPIDVVAEYTLPAGVNTFQISIGDNLYEELYVLVVDAFNHRSPAVKLFNDIIPPPVLKDSIVLHLGEENNADYVTPVTDRVTGRATSDTTLITVYKDSALNWAIGTAVPGADLQWEVTVTEDIIWDFVYVTAQDGEIEGEGDGMRHPGNESDDLRDEIVEGVDRKVGIIRVPNGAPMIQSVVVTENDPGSQDTVRVVVETEDGSPWTPDADVYVRVFNLMGTAEPAVVTPFATQIQDVKDMASDNDGNVLVAAGNEVLQLTQVGNSRMLFDYGIQPVDNILMDNVYTGRLFVMDATGFTWILDPSTFVPGTPLTPADAINYPSVDILASNMVGLVIDPANSTSTSLRLVYASRGSSDILQGTYSTITGFGVASVRSTITGTAASLAFDRAGNLFVGVDAGSSDADSDYLLRIEPAGRETVVASGLNSPTGLAVDTEGRVYVNQLTYREVAMGLRGEVLVYQPTNAQVEGTLLRSIHTTFEGTPVRPAIDPSGRMYFSSRTAANISRVFQGVMNALIPDGVDSGSDGVADRFGDPIYVVDDSETRVPINGVISLAIGDNQITKIAVIAVRKGGFTSGDATNGDAINGAPVIRSNDIVAPQMPVGLVTDAVSPLKDFVDGYAERQSTVKVWDNESATGLPLNLHNVGTVGDFQELPLGDNTLPDYWAAAMDAAGNMSGLRLLQTDIEINTPATDKINVICNLPGTDDMVIGDPFAVEAYAWVRIYSDELLNLMVGSPVQAGADGSFAYSIGDNVVGQMWLLAVDSAGNISKVITLLNDIVGPTIDESNLTVMAYEQGAQDFIISEVGSTEGGATVEIYYDPDLLNAASPDAIAVADELGALGVLNMGDDAGPELPGRIGEEPFDVPHRSFFLRAMDECGNYGPIVELLNPFVEGASPVDVSKIIVTSRETLLTDDVYGTAGAVEPFAMVEVYYDFGWTLPVLVDGIAAATESDQWGQFPIVNLGDDLAEAFYLKVTDVRGNPSSPIQIRNPFVPGISEVELTRLHVFSNQHGVDDFLIGNAAAVEPKAEVAIFFDSGFTMPVPGAVETADVNGAFGPINLGDDLATEFFLRSIDEVGHISAPVRLFNPTVENPVPVSLVLFDVIANEELVDDYIVARSGAVVPRSEVLIYTNWADAIAISEDLSTHEVLDFVPDVIDDAPYKTVANDFGGFDPVNVGDDVSDMFYVRVITKTDDTYHISSPLLLRNPLVPGVVDVDPFRLRVVANEQGVDDYIVGDTGAIEANSAVEVFTVDFSGDAGAVAVRTGSVDEFGRFSINIGDDEYRTGDELETVFWLRFTDTVGHTSPPYRVVNPFIMGTQRPDVMRIRVISNRTGYDDLVVGVDLAVEANAEVRIYSDAGLTTLVATTTADMWGAFGPVSVGDDLSEVFWLVSIDNLDNESSALKLLNPFAPTQPQENASGFVVLDGFGGLHTRNVYPALETVGVNWRTPIFKAVDVVSNGFYTLKGDGPVFAFGEAEKVKDKYLPNGSKLFGRDTDQGVDIKAYEATPGVTAGCYVLDCYGEVYTVRVSEDGYPPYLSSGPMNYYYDECAVALEMMLSSSGRPTGHMVMNNMGNITATFGGSYGSAVSAALGVDLVSNGDAVDFELITDSNNVITGILVLTASGDVIAIGNAPDIAERPVFGSAIARDIEVDPSGRGYYVMDGLGGIHTVGNITPLAEPPFFGFDIARDLDIIFASEGSQTGEPPVEPPASE